MSRYKVYFIESPAMKAVKIGRAKNPQARLAMLQCGNPDTLAIRHVMLEALLDEGEAGWTEPQLHARFAHLRLRGEWFRLADDLLAFLEAPTYFAKTVVLSQPPPRDPVHEEIRATLLASGFIQD